MRKTGLKLLGLVLSSTLLATACPNSVWAAGLQSKSAKSYQGGTSGGGGTIVYSTEKDIKETLGYIFMGARYFADTPSLVAVLSDLDSRRGDVRDPKLKKIFNKMFAPLDGASMQSIMLVSQMVQTEIQNAPCIDKDGNQRAATVASVNLGSGWPQDSRGIKLDTATGKYPNAVHLCYSVSELEKIPRANLYQQLVSLTIHEMTHVYGYDEETAEKVQNFLLEDGKRLVNNDMDQIDFFKVQVVSVSTTLMQIKDVLRRKSTSDMQLCMLVGQANWAVISLNESLYNQGVNFEEPLASSLDTVVENLNSAQINAAKFCEGKGTRAVLEKTVLGMDKQVNYLMKVLKIN